MRPIHPITFKAGTDDLNLLSVIHPDEVITMRGLQADLARLQAEMPLVRLSAREPSGIAFTLAIIGFGVDTEKEAAFRQFDFNFASHETPEQHPTVLYLTSPERSRQLLGGQDACRLVLEPDQPITAGTLKAFIENLGVSNLTFEPDGPYLAIRDASSQMMSDFRRRNRPQPRYQPCDLRLVCEHNEAGQICAVRIEVTANGRFDLRSGHQVSGIARVSSRNGTAYGWVEPIVAVGLLWDYLGEAALWATAIRFAKALGFHPENMGELELVIDERRTWHYMPDAVSDRT
jgi:hypothetical protein